MDERLVCTEDEHTCCRSVPAKAAADWLVCVRIERERGESNRGGSVSGSLFPLSLGSYQSIEAEKEELAVEISKGLHMFFHLL